MLALTGALLLAWDASGLDLSVARWSGSAAGFALRDNWWLTVVLHDGAHKLAWAVALLLCLGVWWPVGALRDLTLAERLQLASTPLLAVLAVNLLKRASGANCPWDLSPFGGMAPWLSHWSTFWQADGGGGHCFPAGHASSGFAFVGGWLVWRRRHPVIAWRWLALALAVGALLGLSQQLRGAHFTSHTLWTLWVCAATAAVVDAAFRRGGLNRVWT